MPVSLWSTTPSSNATADAANGINWAEGMSPAQVNDSARAMMAVIKGDFANAIASGGYQKLPNGLIIQWGSIGINPVSVGSQDHSGTVTFPIAFPTACLQVIPGGFDPILSGDPRLFGAVTIQGRSQTACVFNLRNNVDTSGIGANLTWIAVGY